MLPLFATFISPLVGLQFRASAHGCLRAGLSVSGYCALLLFVLILADVVDVFGSASSEIIGGAELALINKTEERVNYIRLKLGTAGLMETTFSKFMRLRYLRVEYIASNVSATPII